MRVGRILEVLAKAQRPINGNQIKAAELLLTDPEFRDEVDPEGLTDALRAHALVLEDEAKAFAATHKLGAAKALTSVWFRKSRKKRKWG